MLGLAGQPGLSSTPDYSAQFEPATRVLPKCLSLFFPIVLRFGMIHSFLWNFDEVDIFKSKTCKISALMFWVVFNLRTFGWKISIRLVFGKKKNH